MIIRNKILLTLLCLVFSLFIYKYINYFKDFSETPHITIRPFRIGDRFETEEYGIYCSLNKSVHYLVTGYKEFTQHDKYLDSFFCLIIDSDSSKYSNYSVTFLKESKYTNDSTSLRIFSNYSIHHDRICDYRSYQGYPFSKYLYRGEWSGKHLGEVICK
ncbi:MAG: hypothetical protein IPG55_20225 [Saprospiraceae bacterium]|nr:hypothetical protein [Candidatus Defluviibacterium haderslevense]MBK7243199.1 hypothetical protein [Candidatus Defluviibacterium haderslevense]